MNKYIIFDILIIIILILSYTKIENSNNLIVFIYVFLILYHIYISIFVFVENYSNNKTKIIIFFIVCPLLYLFTYFIIFDTNPFFFITVYYLFFPDFWKSILIIFIHSYILSIFLLKDKKYTPKENNSDFNENSSLKGNIYNYSKSKTNIPLKNYYFLFGLFSLVKKTKKRFFMQNTLWE